MLRIADALIGRMERTGVGGLVCCVATLLTGLVCCAVRGWPGAAVLSLCGSALINVPAPADTPVVFPSTIFIFYSRLGSVIEFQ